MAPRNQLSKPWVVVGGGMLGMTLAARLAQAGCPVKLFEESPSLGGLADSWQIGDVVWDRHYHVTLLSDLHLRGLLAELGIERHLRWNNTRTGFFVDGRLHSMSSIWEYLRFPPLRLSDKLRLGYTIHHASRHADPRVLESKAAIDWLTELSGERTVDRLWRPLLTSKLGTNADRVSASFIHATIARLYAARRTGMKEEMVGYVPGGYHRIHASLTKHLHSLGVETFTSRPVRRIDQGAGGGLRFEFDNARGEDCETAVLTIPPPAVADLCPWMPAPERDAFRSVEYQGILCGSMVLRRPLSSYYVTNITDDTLPFTGIIDMTALVDSKEFRGHGLVYLPKYVTQEDPAWSLSDGELRRSFEEGLSRVHRAFRSEDVLAFRVSRVRSVFALPTLNYSRRLPPMRTSAPGLLAISSAHILNGTLNVNETVGLANRTAAWLLANRGRPAEDCAQEPETWVRFWNAPSQVSQPHRREELRRFLPRVEQSVGLGSEEVVLDIGSGPGTLAAIIADRVKEVHCADTSPSTLDLGRIQLAGRPNVYFHLLDPHRYTRLEVLGSRQFSLVICGSVVQYYRTAEELADLVKEIQRVAAPGARLLITDIPAGSSAIFDTLGLLWNALAAGRLATTLGYLGRTALSDYGSLRKRHGLVRYSTASLAVLLQKLELRGEVIHGGLSPLPNRLHLLVRFDESQKPQVAACNPEPPSGGI